MSVIIFIILLSIEVKWMNEAALAFWNEYWGREEKPVNVGAYCFGDTPDELAAI